MHVYNGIRLGNEKRNELLIRPTGTHLKCIILSKEARFKKRYTGTYLVAQWLRICLPWEDPEGSGGEASGEEGSGWGIHVYPRLIHVNV